MMRSQDLVRAFSEPRKNGPLLRHKLGCDCRLLVLRIRLPFGFAYLGISCVRAMSVADRIKNTLDFQQKTTPIIATPKETRAQTPA